MANRSFEFDSPHGHRLSGVLETPVATVRGWAIFAHCFTCGKDSPAAACIARGLARAGIGVLRFALIERWQPKQVGVHDVIRAATDAGEPPVARSKASRVSPLPGSNNRVS